MTLRAAPRRRPLLPLPLCTVVPLTAKKLGRGNDTDTLMESVMAIVSRMACASASIR